jgi:hypothetical protein
MRELKVFKARFISYVALAGLVIFDSYKSKYTRHILLRSRLEEFATTQLPFLALRSCYVILTCLVDCLSKVFPQSLRKGS